MRASAKNGVRVGKQGEHMGKVFAGQTALRVTVKTFRDLEGIKNAIIRFRKPDGSSGEFTASVGDEAKGIIFYECIEGDIDVSGWWTFWAFITFHDNRTAAGEATRVFIWEEGR